MNVIILPTPPSRVKDSSGTGACFLHTSQTRSPQRSTTMKKPGLIIAFILITFASVALAADLTFTEGNNFAENGSFLVIGFVKNTSNYTMKDITITVKYYDKQANFLLFASPPASPTVLGPDEEASYRAVIPEDERIASIKKTARWTAEGEN